MYFVCTNGEYDGTVALASDGDFVYIGKSDIHKIGDALYVKTENDESPRKIEEPLLLFRNSSEAEQACRALNAIKRRELREIQRDHNPDAKIEDLIAGVWQWGRVRM